MLITSALQKASRLGRREGGDGIRFGFSGDMRRDLEGLLGGGGGVLGRAVGGALRGERLRVGELGLLDGTDGMI